MSRIDEYMKHVGGPKPNCSICGYGPADAFWMADTGNFFVCHQCAITVFAKLLGDIGANRINAEVGDPREQIDQVLREFEGEFHRTMVVALCRELARTAPGIEA